SWPPTAGPAPAPRPACAGRGRRTSPCTGRRRGGTGDPRAPLLAGRRGDPAGRLFQQLLGPEWAAFHAPRLLRAAPGLAVLRRRLPVRPPAGSVRLRPPRREALLPPGHQAPGDRPGPARRR